MRIADGKAVRLAASAACLMVLLAGVPLRAQPADPVDPFVLELARQLKAAGWSEEAVGAFTLEARAMNWSEAAAADPQLVALALRYAARDGSGELDGRQHARLAQEVALMAREMERLGLDEPAITRAAMNGVHELLGEVRARRGLDGPGTGDLIRLRLQDQLRLALHDADRLAEQARQRSRAGSGPASGGPGGPAWGRE